MTNKTLRDEFAMAALTGLFSWQVMQSWESMAVSAYSIADAMLAEREKGNNDDR